MPHRVQVPPSHAEKSEVTSSVVDIVKANISCTLKKKREKERERKERRKDPTMAMLGKRRLKKKNE